MVVVVCGCLAVFGIVFSTVSAQSDGRIAIVNQVALLTVMAASVQFGRRRRRRPATEASTTAAGVAASYSRYSSDQQREESITDQRRKCQEMAQQNGHQILPEFEYFDEAVSGTKLRRQGLDALLRDAEAGEFRVLYFHSLSRLARESVITMPMLKQLVHVFKVRVISVTEGIDSDRDGWEVIASIMSLLHERYIKELSANVFRGQEGTALKGFSVGDFRFGYRSKPIPGSEQGRRGRNAKPRMMYEIDDVAAPWVLRIFHWFVREHRSLRWIAKELNRRSAPKDHRASTKLWRHQQVAGLLVSPKYVGIWPWGEMRNTRDPLTGKVRQEPRTEEECEKWVRELPHLQIVDHQIFQEAQQRLEEHYQRHVATRKTDGTFKGSRTAIESHPRHLLSGLIKCGECGNTFHVGGTNGRYMFCPGYRTGVCKCQTQLRRDRAERIILDEIGKRVLENPTWCQAVYQQTLKSWGQQEEQLPQELAAAERTLADVEQKIARLVDRIENGVEDPAIQERIDDRRRERRDLVKKADRLKRLAQDRGPAPTEAWVREQLAKLGQCLTSDEPAAAYALRDLVGGKIEVTEIRRDGRSRHHLRGQFTISSSSVSQVIGANASDTDQTESIGLPSELVIVDFVDSNPLDAKANEAKALYDAGLMNAVIAERLGCARSQVTKLLRHWFESRGERMPDGRHRRSQLVHKTVEAPLYQRIADEVKRLSDDQLLLQEIAERLACDRNVVTKAISYWYESRGLPAPDGRSRRKTLARKQS